MRCSRNPSLPAQDGASGAGVIDGALGCPRHLRVRIETLTWAALLVMTVLSRVPALGFLPLRLPDSGRAFAAWQVSAGRLPATWNGDLAQSMTAAIFKLAGAGDGAARTASALAGIGLIAVLIAMRPLLGRAPALLAAALLALSPVCVVVSRSVSAYSTGALFATAAAAALLAFLDRPRPAPLAWLAAVLGLGLSTDATFLVFVLAAALFCLVEGLWLGNAQIAGGWIYIRAHAPLVRSLLLISSAGLLLSLTRFGIATDRLQSGAMGSWSDAFRAAGRAAPWHFPLDVLLAYEPLLLVAGCAGVVLIMRDLGRGPVVLWQRLALYWLVAGLCFALIVRQREMGQLPVLLVPLALVAGAAFARWLSSATKEGLRPAVAPALLAVPALVYVLFLLESSTVQGGLPPGQIVSVLSLFAGALMLLALGAFWSQRAAPAFLAVCSLVIGVGFALHSLSRAGFRSGDEFILGPMATNQAPAFSNEVLTVAPSLRGVVSVSPSLSEPLAWYLRAGPTVRFQAPTRASAGVVQAAGAGDLPGFQPFISGNDVARRWYPVRVDFSGLGRWLLYRQAWEPVQSTTAEYLIKQ